MDAFMQKKKKVTNKNVLPNPINSRLNIINWGGVLLVSLIATL